MRLAFVLAVLLATVSDNLTSQGTYTVNPGNVRSSDKLVQGDRPPGPVADRAVTLVVQDSTIRYVINELARQAKLRPLYSDTIARLNQRIRVRVSNMGILDALATVFKGTGLTAKLAADGETLMIRGDTTPANSVNVETGNISGRVLDSATRKGVGGVTVTLFDQGTKTVTDNDGGFHFRNVPVGKRTLEAKMFGYRSSSASVDVAADKAASIRIVLVGLPTSLTEVVTTVTGSQRRFEIGNSITSLNVDSIVKNTAVNTLTDVIDAGRIPGLVVTRSSGAPGAPARVRVRGINTINATSDPVIIVDGARVYSDQTDSEKNAQYSVLDRIDLNSIETIDVLKGPSASAMYGSDAANGVIVITTKKGGTGPARWNLSTQQQRTTQHGSFPDLYYREGTPLPGRRPFHCLLGEDCVNDTVYVFNPLANSRTTALDAGYRQSYSADVSGGTSTIRYAMTVSLGDEIGLLKLPDADAELLTKLTGRPVPGWLKRPQSSTNASATGNVDIQITPDVRSRFSTNFSTRTRRTTPLSRVLGVYATSGPGDSSVITGSIADFNRQETYPEHSLRNGVSTTWSGLNWLTVVNNLGYDAALRAPEKLLRRADCIGQCITKEELRSGSYEKQQQWNTVASVNLNANASLPRKFGLRLTPNAGFDVQTQQGSENTVTAKSLVLGATSSDGADTVRGTENSSRRTLAGFFIGTRIAVFDRFYTGLEIRSDASNALGARVRPTYPKLDLSYLVSDEPWAPKAFSELRLRLAYGHAAVQPLLGAQARTYEEFVRTVDGVSETMLTPLTGGNPLLRPERSTELEVGVDFRTFRDRLSLSFTVYNKRTKDAFTTFTLPGSLGASNYTMNLGAVRNRGTEAQFDVRILDGGNINWGIDGAISQNMNRLESIAPGMDRFSTPSGQRFFGPRNVVGYPVQGTWMQPMVAYEDLNGDGMLDASEIMRSDSSVFVGTSYPKYGLSFGSNLGLWKGRVTMNARMAYSDGFIQINQAAISNLQGNFANSYTNTMPKQTLRGVNDPTLPIAEQALIRSGHAFINTVSTLRLSSFSVSAIVPSSVVSALRARTMTVSIQGSNLGLWTNYSGFDPNVNNSIVGNSNRDSGNLPLPRTWGVNVRLGY